MSIPHVIAWLVIVGTIPSTFAASPAPAVTVAFVDAAAVGDIADRPDGDRVRAAYVESLRDYLVMRATPRLASGQAFDVRITRVVSPGTIEPSRLPGNEPRILRDVSPARIDLRFRLVAPDGTVLRSGDRTLRDPTLFGSPALNPTDPLRYEKALLDRWIESELPEGPGSRG